MDIGNWTKSMGCTAYKSDHDNHLFKFNVELIRDENWVMVIRHPRIKSQFHEYILPFKSSVWPDTVMRAANAKLVALGYSL